MLTDKREYERGELLYRKVVTLPRTFGGAFTNLIIAQIRNGRVVALDSTAAAYRGRFLDRTSGRSTGMPPGGRGGPTAPTASRGPSRAAPSARQSIRSAGPTAAVAYMHAASPRRALGDAAGRGPDARHSVGRGRLAFALDTAFHALQAGDPAGGRAAVQRGLARHPTDSMPPDERPWENLSWLAAGLGDAPLARLALAGYERDLASTSVAPVGATRVLRGRRRAGGAAVGRGGRAPAGGGRETGDRRAVRHVQLGRAHDQAGRSDSAVVYYEKFITSPDPFPIEDGRARAQIHRRLGELYEAAGKSRQATEHYGRFVELWAKADPALQPQVAEVRKRLERLRAQVG